MYANWFVLTNLHEATGIKKQRPFDKTDREYSLVSTDDLIRHLFVKGHRSRSQQAIVWTPSHGLLGKGNAFNI